LKHLEGKTYGDLSELPHGELRRLALAFPHPGHERPKRITLRDGRVVFVRHALLTPHVHLKPRGRSMREWLAGLSEDERLGHALHVQHRKLLFDSFPFSERVYGNRTDWLVDHLLDRLPERHPLRVGYETMLVAHDADGKLAGFIQGLTPRSTTRRKTALMGYVCVAPNYRNVGLTRSLYSQMWRKLAEQGVRVVFGESAPFGKEEAARRVDLLRKKAEKGLNGKERAELSDLTRARGNLRFLSNRGRLVVEGVRYVVPVFDGSRRVLPMTLVATVLRRDARGRVSLNRGGRISLAKLEKAILGIHSSYIYETDCHSIPVLRREFERLKNAGVKSIPLVSFNK
jgi:ribosomal protein S18 acetylase RimI-like enzyme